MKQRDDYLVPKVENGDGAKWDGYHVESPRELQERPDAVSVLEFETEDTSAREADAVVRSVVRQITSMPDTTLKSICRKLDLRYTDVVGMLRKHAPAFLQTLKERRLAAMSARSRWGAVLDAARERGRVTIPIPARYADRVKSFRIEIHLALQHSKKTMAWRWHIHRKGDGYEIVRGVQDNPDFYGGEDWFTYEQGVGGDRGEDQAPAGIGSVDSGDSEGGGGDALGCAAGAT